MAQKYFFKKIKECVTAAEINYLELSITFRENDIAAAVDFARCHLRLVLCETLLPKATNENKKMFGF